MTNFKLKYIEKDQKTKVRQLATFIGFFVVFQMSQNILVLKNFDFEESSIC